MTMYSAFIALLLVTVVTSASVSNNAGNKKVTFDFRGLMAPVFTPFHDDESLNIDVITDYAKYLASKNIKGMLIGGTTGEGTLMSVKERKQLAEAWASAAKDNNQHLMVQVGGGALVDVKELAAHAEKIGANSILCLPEIYFKPDNVEDLINYLAEVGRAAPNTPLIYYQSTKAKINAKASDLLKLVGNRIPTLAGVKLDSSDMADGMGTMQYSDKFVTIYGAKMNLLAACSVGVDVFMTATLSFLPEYSANVLDYCHGHGDLETARQNQNTINILERQIKKNGGPIESMKTAMSVITGLNMGPARSPLKPLSCASIQTMQSLLQESGFRLY